MPDNFSVSDYLYYFLILAILILVLVVVSQLIKRWVPGGGISRQKGMSKRLEVLATHPLDIKRHLSLIRFDDAEILLLLSDSGNLLLAGPQNSLSAQAPDMPSGKLSQEPSGEAETVLRRAPVLSERPQSTEISQGPTFSEDTRGIDKKGKE